MPATKLNIQAPAKINLTLEILYRRNDGFHQLETVMQELDFGDMLSMEEDPRGNLQLICDYPLIPAGKDNLALKAALLLQERYAPGRGARLILIKKIPMAAGLGGGSSDAAAVLKGLNELWQLKLQTEDLQDLAAGLGSDVAFFLYGGTALARGRGELIEPLPAFPPMHVLLVLPQGKELSTPLVYRTLMWDKIKNGQYTAAFIRLLEQYAHSKNVDLAELRELMVNDLEPAAVALLPELNLLKGTLQQMGLKPLLSGSGPTFFVLSQDVEKLRFAYETLKTAYHVILTSTAARLEKS